MSGHLTFLSKPRKFFDMNSKILPNGRTFLFKLGLMGVLMSAIVHAAPGDPVPAFDLVDLSGKQHTPSEYTGQILLLFFLGHN